MHQDDIDEMAIPSYLHKNPFVRWIVFMRMQKITELVKSDKKSIHVLDFGCGTGMLNLQFQNDEIDYHGVDLITWPAEFVLNKAGKKNYKIINADNWFDDFEDNSLDCIVCIEVLEHLTKVELEELMYHFEKKLNPNGKLIVSGPTESVFYRLMRKVAGFSGAYHETNIFRIRKVIEKKSSFIADKSIKLPIPGWFTLFEIIRYKVTE